MIIIFVSDHPYFHEPMIDQFIPIGVYDVYFICNRNQKSNFLSSRCEIFNDKDDDHNDDRDAYYICKQIGFEDDARRQGKIFARI